MLKSINVLKFIAAVLIVNSHLDKIYPISSLATGGAIGNAIFFAVSGYCLANIKQTFPKWYGKRLLRIYPKTIIVTTILVAIGHISINEIMDIPYYYIYPTYYWFVGGIALFYLIYYLLHMKGYNKKVNGIFTIGLLLAYAIYYVLVLDTSIWIVEDNIISRYMFYFLVMLFGRYLREHYEDIKNVRFCIGKLISSVIIYFGFKFAINIHPFLMHFQFLTQVLTIPVVYYLFMLTIKNEEWFKTEAGKAKQIVINIMEYIGSLTLEIYLVHIPVIKLLPKMIFPINFVVIVALTIVLSVLLKQIVGIFEKKGARNG